MDRAGGVRREPRTLGRMTEPHQPAADRTDPVPTAPDQSAGTRPIDEPPGAEHPLVERTGVVAGDPALLRERDTAFGALTTVRSSTLAPLVRAVAVGDAHALTHRVPEGSVDLAALRAAVPLRPGHVVTVLGAVLDALDALHRAHLAHGGVDVERVLVGTDGAAVLAGCGLAWSVPPGAPGGPEPADDVADVAVLARRLLGPGSAPPALVIALLRAADPDPTLRPDAAELAIAVRAALPEEPLLDLLWLSAASPAAPVAAARSSLVAPSRSSLVVPDAAGRPGDAPPRPAARRRPEPTRPAVDAGSEPSPATVLRPPRRRARRRPRASALLVAALALPLVGWGALRLPAGAAADPAVAPVGPRPSVPATATRPDPEPPAPTRAQIGPAASWVQVLGRLDAQRRRAVVAGSRALLADAVDPAGAAWVADAALVDRVRSSGARVSGGALVPTAVEVIAAAGDRVRLRVRDVRTAYDVARAGVTTHVPERAEATWEVTLVRTSTSSGWRIGEVETVARGSIGQ